MIRMHHVTLCAPEPLSETAGDGATRLLTDIDCAFRAGEITLLAGRTGSGKTSLLHVLAGLIPPDQGVIRYGDTPLWRGGRIKEAVKLASGLVFQYPERQLFAASLRKEFRYSLRPYGVRKAEATRRIDRAMRQAQLPAELLERSVFALSDGQKRRAALAVTLATEPRWLLLDEPTAGIDPAAIGPLLAALRAHAAAGGGVIVASHDLDAFFPAADRVLVLAGGRMAGDRTPAAWQADPAALLEAGLGLPSAARLAAALGEPPSGRVAAALRPEQAAEAILQRLGGARAAAAPAVRASAREAAGPAAPPSDAASAAEVAHVPAASQAALPGASRFVPCAPVSGADAPAHDPGAPASCTDSPVPIQGATVPGNDAFASVPGATASYTDSPVPIQGATVPGSDAFASVPGAPASCTDSPVPKHGTTVPGNDAFASVPGAPASCTDPPVSIHGATVPGNNAFASVPGAAAPGSDAPALMLDAPTSGPDVPMTAYGAQASSTDASVFAHGASVSGADAPAFAPGEPASGSDGSALERGATVTVANATPPQRAVGNAKRRQPLQPLAGWVFYMLVSTGIVIQDSGVGAGLAAALVAGYLITNRVAVGPVVRPLRPLLYFLVFSTLLSGLNWEEAFGEQHAITFSGEAARLTAMRLGILLLISALSLGFAQATGNRQMQKGIDQALALLSRCHVPTGALSLYAALMLRFVPQLRAEIGRMSLIVRARGKTYVKPGTMRLRDAPAFLIPLLLSLLKHADDLTLALEARGFRLKRYADVKAADVIRFDRRDLALMGAGALAFALLLAVDLNTP